MVYTIFLPVAKLTEKMSTNVLGVIPNDHFISSTLPELREFVQTEMGNNLNLICTDEHLVV